MGITRRIDVTGANITQGLGTERRGIGRGRDGRGTGRGPGSVSIDCSTGDRFKDFKSRCYLLIIDSSQGIKSRKIREDCS